MTLHDTAHPLVRELLRVHDTLRRDLRTCRELAGTAPTAPQAELRTAVDRLASRGPLFQLRAHCLGYCRLVHAHHSGEDLVLFPVVRASAPQLTAVLDRLERDHRVVSDLLDEIEAAALNLDDDPVEHAGENTAGSAARARLADALGTLSTHLLEHLEVEEQALAPVLRSWTGWPQDLPTGVPTPAQPTPDLRRNS